MEDEQHKNLTRLLDQKFKEQSEQTRNLREEMNKRFNELIDFLLDIRNKSEYDSSKPSKHSK